MALGNGPNNEILHLTSAHSNFSSYVSVFTLLLLLMELTGRYPTYMLHSLGIMFVLGRLSHLFAFRTPHTVNKFRTAGMILTLMPIVVTAVSNVLSYFQNGIR